MRPVSSIALALCASLVAQSGAAATHDIIAHADGTFTPPTTTAMPGDTVHWYFEDPRGAVVPVAGPGVCDAAEPWNANESNLAGPMPVAEGGLWVRGPHEWGAEIAHVGDPNAPCSATESAFHAGDRYLCNTGPANRTLKESWEHPDTAGVFVQLPWKAVHKGPGDYDFGRLSKELDAAVAHGKLVTLSFKAGAHGTPDWIFDNLATDHQVKKLTFQDRGSDECAGKDCCGTVMDLGSPADPNYRRHYFDMWRAVAAHVRSSSAWFRAIAGVKPSGLNLFTHENRLPHRCNPDCDICNSEVWALDGGYTPDIMLDFYAEQFDMLAKEFPGKDQIFMLIQGGWPRVGGPDLYEHPGMTYEPPGPVPQTEALLALGALMLGDQFVVQHNGLGVSPAYLGKSPCPQHGMPATPTKLGGKSSGCPNKWVVEAYYDGQVTGFQTNNGNKISSGETLQSALENGWDSSGGIFVEVYEALLWSLQDEPLLSPNESNDTLADWHQRYLDRAAAYHGGPMSTFAAMHTWIVPGAGTSLPTSTSPVTGPPSDVFTFVNPVGCVDGAADRFGMLVVL